MKRPNRIRMLCGLMALLMLPLWGCGKSQSNQPSTGDTDQKYGGIVCLEYSRYSNGLSPETDQPATNVAAMLIHNSTKEFLEYATIEARVGQETGTFYVTGLPPGAMAWVLEKTGMTIVEGETFEALPCEDYYFNPDAVMSTDKLSVRANGNILTVTNTSGKTLKNVSVYYKTVQEDGIYLGGRGFLLVFGDLPPGASATKEASHYGAASKIVRYSFQESG